MKTKTYFASLNQYDEEIIKYLNKIRPKINKMEEYYRLWTEYQKVMLLEQLIHEIRYKTLKGI